MASRDRDILEQGVRSIAEQAAKTNEVIDEGSACSSDESASTEGLEAVRGE